MEHLAQRKGQEAAVITVLVLLLLPAVNSSSPASAGHPQAPAESSLPPPESEGATQAQPEKNTGQVPAHDGTTIKEPIRQAACQESESEEAGGAGKWGRLRRGPAARSPGVGSGFGRLSQHHPSPSRRGPGRHAVHHEAERGAHRPRGPPEEPPVRGGQRQVRDPGLSPSL